MSAKEPVLVLCKILAERGPNPRQWSSEQFGTQLEALRGSVARTGSYRMPRFLDQVTSWVSGEVGGRALDWNSAVSGPCPTDLEEKRLLLLGTAWIHTPDDSNQRKFAFLCLDEDARWAFLLFEFQWGPNSGILDFVSFTQKTLKANELGDLVVSGLFDWVTLKQVSIRLRDFLRDTTRRRRQKQDQAERARDEVDAFCQALSQVG